MANQHLAAGVSFGELMVSLRCVKEDPLSRLQEVNRKLREANARMKAANSRVDYSLKGFKSEASRSQTGRTS